MVQSPTSKIMRKSLYSEPNGIDISYVINDNGTIEIYAEIPYDDGFKDVTLSFPELSVIDRHKISDDEITAIKEKITSLTEGFRGALP